MVELLVDVVAILILGYRYAWWWLLQIFLWNLSQFFYLVILCIGNVVATGSIVDIRDSTDIPALINLTNCAILELWVPVSSPALFHHFLFELVLIKVVSLYLLFFLLVHWSVVIVRDLPRYHWMLKLPFWKVVLGLFILKERYFFGGFCDCVALDCVLFLYHVNLWLYVLFSVHIVAYDVLIVICSGLLSLLCPWLIWQLTGVLVKYFLRIWLLIPEKLISTIFCPYLTPQITVRFVITSVHVSTVCPFIHVSRSGGWELLARYLMQVVFKSQVWIWQTSFV